MTQWACPVAIPCLLSLLANGATAQGWSLNPRLALTPGAGDVTHFLVSPDGQWVAYRADQLVDERFELFGAPADGSAQPSCLSGALGADRDVQQFPPPRMGPDGRVVYVADAQLLGALEPYIVAVDGSTPPLRLSPPFAVGRAVQDFLISPDGSRVLYLADQDADSLYQLYSAPSDGSQASVRIGPDGAPCLAFTIDPTSSTVAAYFHGGHLWTQALDGASPAVEVAQPVIGFVNPDVTTALGLRFSPDGRWLTYRNVADCGFICSSLYAVPSDGSVPPVKLSVTSSVGERIMLPDSQRVLYIGSDGLVVAALDGSGSSRLDTSPPGTQVVTAALSPDGTTAVYGTRPAPSQFFTELYSVPIDGGAAPLLLGSGLLDTALTFTPDASTVLVLNQDISLGPQLFAVAVDGGLAPRRIADRVGGHVVTSDSSRAIFRADLDPMTPSGAELYTRPLDLSAPIRRLDQATGGNVGFSLALAGNRVVFSALVDSATQLFSVPIDASSAPQLLNAPLPAGPPIVGDVQEFVVTEGGDVVLLRADDELDEQYQLLVSHPWRGSRPVRLNGPLGMGEGVQPPLGLSADGSRAAFWVGPGSDGNYTLQSAPTDVFGVRVTLATSSALSVLALSNDGARVLHSVDGVGLFSVPSDGGGPPVDLGPSLLVVRGMALVPDGSRVIYWGDELPSERDSLFSAPVDGSAARVRLAPIGPAAYDVLDVRLSPDGTQVAFRADPADERFELFVVPVDESQPEVMLSGPLAAGGDVTHYAFTPDGSAVVYRADERFDERFELFQTPLAAPSPALLAAMPATGDVEPDFRITGDGLRVVYRADATTDDKVDLFSLLLGGGAPVPLYPSLSSATDVATFEVSPDGQTVFFQDNRGGGLSSSLHRASVVTGLGSSVWGRVNGYRFTPNSSHLVFAVPATAPNRPQTLRTIALEDGEIDILGSTVPGGVIDTFETYPGGRIVLRGEGRTLGVHELFANSIGHRVRGAPPPR